MTVEWRNPARLPGFVLWRRDQIKCRTCRLSDCAGFLTPLFVLTFRYSLRPPSITLNRLRRSGAVSVGSGVATAKAASINSPSDHG